MCDGDRITSVFFLFFPFTLFSNSFIIVSTLGGGNFGILQFRALGHLLPVFNLKSALLISLPPFLEFCSLEHLAPASCCNYSLRFHFTCLTVISHLLFVISLPLWLYLQQCFAFRCRRLTEVFILCQLCICLFCMCPSAMLVGFPPGAILEFGSVVKTTFVPQFFTTISIFVLKS